MPNQTLEKQLWEQIPLIKAMKVRVIRATDGDVELACPLAPNHNHVGTAFGGSLNALMILAGYVWLFNYLSSHEMHDAKLLLKSCEAKFHEPIAEELHAHCTAPLAKDRQNFLNSLKRKGLGRLSLDSYVLRKDGVKACMLTGEFVARRSNLNKLRS